jgi:rRNA-processing protein FCF1
VSASLKVVMDANFLMIPGQFGVNIIGELESILDVKYELIIPNRVREELITLSKKGSLKERKAARIGLELTKNLRVVNVKGETTDDAIITLVDRNTVVCTNDKLLRKKVLEKGGKSIFLRQKKFLVLEGGEVGLS